jgi:GDPmannose 4,6-dehydratase/GDP-4-dehydro-6-deoxy-D-mannose reductase
MRPVNPYAASKMAQEALAYSYAQSAGLKIFISRAFAYINPRRRDLFASSFAYQIAEIEAGKRDVLKHGNLDSVRTLIDVRDIARAYWLMFDKCEPGEPYNIGGNIMLSVGHFLEMLLHHSKIPVKCVQDKNLLRPKDVTRQVPDTSKFDTLTGFKTQYSIDESIDWLLDHCRKETKCSP